MKKLLALILAALMATSFVACSDKNDEPIEDLKDYLMDEVIVNHETIAETGETFYFDRVDSESVVITRYESGDNKHPLRIPEVLDGKKVVSIAANAFKDCTSITSIEFPSTLKTIQPYAFANCSLVTALTIPASVTSIGTGAFVQCSSITTVTFAEGIALTEITADSFRNCTSLTAIVIPDSVQTIDTAAFMGCTNLASITVGAGVKEIAKQAFQNSDVLETLVLPASLTTMEEELVFSGNHSLNTVYFMGNAEQWAAIQIKKFNSIEEKWEFNAMSSFENLALLTPYFYSAEQPADAEGNYWHYVEGVVTAW